MQSGRFWKANYYLSQIDQIQNSIPLLSGSLKKPLPVVTAHLQQVEAPGFTFLVKVQLSRIPNHNPPVRVKTSLILRGQWPLLKPLLNLWRIAEAIVTIHDKPSASLPQTFRHITGRPRQLSSVTKQPSFLRADPVKKSTFHNRPVS